MEGKPIHYDGSIQLNSNLSQDSASEESFVLTEDMRSNISGNPFNYETK